MADTDTDVATSNAPRSPAYPYVALQRAIELAAKLYAEEKKSAAPLESVAKHWGYAIKSSGLLQSIAALKRFGLLDDVDSGKNRQVRITRLALRILLGGSDNSSDYQAAIREASLNPSIYRELWEAYSGELPSDQTLKRKLVLELNFTEPAAELCIKGLRETMQFVQSVTVPVPRLASVDTINAMDELNTGTKPHEGHEDLGDIAAIRIPDVPGVQVRQITLPVSGGTAVIKIPYPVSGQSFDRLIKMLELWRDELVEKKD